MIPNRLIKSHYFLRYWLTSPNDSIPQFDQSFGLEDRESKREKERQPTCLRRSKPGLMLLAPYSNSEDCIHDQINIVFGQSLPVRYVQRYEQEIDCSTIVVVCQPTPLPKLGRSCVRLWGYFLIIPHSQPKLGISWRVVGWIFLILPQIDSQSSNWVYWIKEGSQQLTSAI